MPLKKAGRGASKKAKQKCIAQNMHETKGSGRPRKQRIAMSMRSCGASRKKR